MAVSSVSVSSTDTVNTVTVTDTSNISVVTVGEQGLGGPSTVLGRGVASLTAGSSDDNAMLIYEHANTAWTTTAQIDDAVNVGAITVRSGGVATLPEIRTATIKYSDGDAAITIADGGTVNIASVNLTTVTLSGKLTADNNEIEGGNFDINGGDIASAVTINKSPTITLGGDLSGSATLTELGNATLTATITADATALGTDTTGAYVETIVAGEGIDVSGSGSETANVTISAEDASDSNKGIASFDATDFSVSSGDVTLQVERIQDIVGAMTTSNTESGISVAYQDADGTLDFDVADFDIALTGDVTGSGTVTNLGNVSFATTIAANSVALGTDTTGNYVADLTAGEGIDVSGGGSENATITVSAEDATSSNKGIASFDSTDFTVSSGAVTINAERISDIVGAMVSSNTESGISVAYQDSDNTLDFDVGDFDVALTGDVTGSGTVTNLGNVSITTTVAANSVALGTDTTGDYVGTITGGTGIDSTAATSGEGTTHTLSLDLNELTTETSIADADFIAMVDASDDGSGKITFENLEDAIFSSVSGDVAIAEDGTATIQANSVALGTDTTGNYMAEVSAGEGIDISHTQAEGSTATISAELATETNAGVATFDGTDFTVSSGDVTINAERVQDIVGAMVGSNTESGIAVTYEDGDGTLDFNVNDPTITIDGDMSGSATMTDLGNTTITSTLDTVNSNVGSFGSATVIPAITVNAKGLVTAVSTNSISTSFTLSADSGSNDTFNTGETLTISGTSNEVETAVSNNEITIGLPDNVTIGGNLTVTGNYTVNGTTTTVNTATLDVEDPLIKLAKANDSSDSVDIGIYGLYDTSGSQDLYTGIFRDASDSGKWKLFKSLQAEPTTTVNTSGTGYAKGTLVADIEGDVTGAVTGNASTATALATGRTIALAGDVTASGVSFDGTGNISLTTTIAANSVALGTDTTGNYVATVADAGNSRITVANSGSETAGVTLDIADNAVGIAQLAGIARGKIIYGDASGNPALLALGADGEVLKSDGTDISWQADTGLSTEAVQDIVGAMFSSNTETGITVTYEDGDGTIDLVVGTLNQDTTGNSATATALETARTIHGVSFDGTANIDLTEVVQDTVGAMFSSNTETGITVSYEDGDGTIDLVVGTLNQDTTGTAALATEFTVSANNSTNETVYPVFVDGATGSQGAETDTGLSYNPSTGNLTIGGELSAATLDISGNVDIDGTLEADALTIDGTTLSETIADTVGAMVSSNTESGITVAYDDSDNTLDFTVATLNQDTTGNAATATALETGRTIGMTGDVVWTSASFDGSGNVTGTATIQANSVALGTDTTGNYVDNVTGGTGVTVSGSAGEGWEPAIAIGQAVGTSDSVTFGSLAVDNFTLNGTELDLSSGDFTLDVAGDINLDADGGDIVLKDGGTQFGKISNASTITQFNTVDSIIVPKGTTGQRPTGVAGMFRYNTTDGKFEGYTNAWGEIGGGGSGLFSTNKFTGDGSTTAFTMSTAPADENYVIAFIDGVYQNKDAFNVSGTTITFDTAPANTKTVIVHVVGSTVSGANANLDTFTGNGSATDFTMALDPVTENNTQVYIDGVYQMKSAYSISGTTLTFSAAPANNASIDVMTFTQNTLNAPANDSVTSAKLSGALVTPSSLDVNGNELILDADADTSITADTDDQIDIKIAGTDQLQLTDGAILPVTTNDIDLGSSSKQFKDAYIDGTLEADAITIAGTSLAETISDTVGAMVGSNTETGIAVTYDDSDNTLDFVLSASQSTITSLGTLTGLTVDGATTTNALKGGSTNFDIYQTTSDGSDNRRTRIGGGGDVAQSRGAFIELAGNEHSDTGDLILNAGDVSGGDILLKTDNTTRIFVKDDGNVGVGTTTPTAKFEVHDDSGGYDSSSVANAVASSAIHIQGNNDMRIIFTEDGSSFRGMLGYEHAGSTYMGIWDSGSSSTPSLVSQGGKIGIGTTSPTDELELRNDQNAETAMSIQNASTASAAHAELLLKNSNGNVGGLRAHGSGFTTSNSSEADGFTIESYRQNLHITASNDKDIKFWNGTSNNVVFKNGGNVGIGTTSPSDELHLYANNAAIRLEDSDSGYSRILTVDGNLYYQADEGNGESSSFHRWDIDGTDNVMRLDATGLGLGTTSPDTELHVSASNNSAGDMYTAVGSGNVPSITIQNSSSTDDVNAALFFKDNSGMRASIGARFVSHASGDQKAQLRFSVTGSGTTREKMVLTEDGNLSLGAVTASHKIEAHSGAVASKYDGDHHVAIRGLSGGQYIQYSSANPLEFVSIDTYPNSGATSRARLTTNGHWLVGTTSSTINSSNFGAVIFSDGRPKFSKNVSGASHVMNVYGNEGEMRVFGDGDVINTNNSYGQISDVSLKENIVDASSKLADINKVKVRNFNFKGNDLKQIGVVAQELETVFPALVTTDEEEDIKTVKYSVFVPILIKALQEADDKIDALEARIKTLEDA